MKPMRIQFAFETAIFDSFFQLFVEAELDTKQGAIFVAILSSIFKAIFRPFIDAELDTKQ
jgi:hypothetical protein